MTLHKEGKATITLGILFWLIINFLSYNFINIVLIQLFILLITSGLLFLIFYFFRFPTRINNGINGEVFSPCDGKVVVIEEVEETEFFNDKRIQVSIFMSPLNVHINWIPIAGILKYYKYHKGKYLVAWHPKSSTENERTTTVIESQSGVQILFRQIAGKLARRIVSYAVKNKSYNFNDIVGFIKLGSRVDVFLPLDSKVLVNINQKVKGNITKIAETNK